MTKRLPVWMYWEGPRFPALDLCIETAEKHCDVQLLDADKAREMGAGECVDRPEIRPEQRADLLRLWLLKREPGAWLDVDVVVLSRPPFEMIFDRRPNASLVGFSGNPKKSLPNHVLVGRPGKGIDAVYQLAQEKSKRKLAYTTIGPAHLTRLYRKRLRGLEAEHRHPWLYAKKANWQRWYWAKPVPRRILPYHMAHVGGPTLRHFRDKTREEVLAADTLFSLLLRQSLEE